MHQKKIYKNEKIGEPVVLDYTDRKEPSSGILLYFLREKIKEEEAKLAALTKKINEEEKKLAQMRDRIIKEAQLEAENILKAAQKEAEKLKEAAIHHGYRDGYSEGITAAETQIKEIIKKLNKILENSKKESFRIIQEAEEQIINLSITIAEKIIREEIKEEKKKILLNIIKAALSKIEADTKIKIRLNPEDASVVSHYKELIKSDKEAEQIEIQEDEDLGSCDCIVETSFGIIDATIASQLEQFKTFLSKNEGIKRL